MRQHGIPKQTARAVSVWVQWACYRCEKIIEEPKAKYPLLTNFVAMSEDGLTFWLVKFVAEVRHSDGKPYPQTASIRYAVDLGMLCMLLTDIDIFNSLGFAIFHDTLDSCMKELKVILK